MIVSSVRAARCLVGALSLCAAAGAQAWTDVASNDSALYSGTGADKQPSRPAKDGAVPPTSSSDPSATRAAERAASQPARKRWIVLAE